MGLDDLVNKGKDLYAKNKEKVDEALRSDRAEEISDRALDGAAGLARKILPDTQDERIDKARDDLDRRIGNDGDR